MKKILIVLLSVILTGCATPYDVDINEDFNKVIINHQEEQTKQVNTKAVQIATIMDYNCPPNEIGTEACGIAKAFMKMKGAEMINEITPQEFNEDRPKTGVDVQDNAVEKVGNGLPVIGGTFVGVKAMDSKQGNRNVAGGDINTNYDEDHATAIGEGAGSTNTPDYTAPTGE